MDPPSTAQVDLPPPPSTTNPITLNVGGRLFTTWPSTLTAHSPFFAALLSDRWADDTRRVDGNLFVDANPDLFVHVLNYLRRSVSPIFWSRSAGFDLPLYAALLLEAQYFGITALEHWIQNQSYRYTVRITQSIEWVAVSDCKRGQVRFFADCEKILDPAEFTVGKSSQKMKELRVQKFELCPPVRCPFSVNAWPVWTNNSLGKPVRAGRYSGRTGVVLGTWWQDAWVRVDLWGNHGKQRAGIQLLTCGWG